ncbi:UPF0082 protein yeeN [Alkalidesulfovibrio alkalitolerans DSM 16529]|jgi:YebC/PmpR family DNA-binding regulatory protein|uniref:Probable transcriptional regulatory protein dsat_2578 n=1 Tax=Alkalidesulfovibrio alkalitolerans DSM 16529 TaxID=1121439 RepID=S7ULN2_9BACT|nr:YebC/PmpR family DNA-binding transcriptional regulator [Alkalidesulfovibrio alkalitolerans]EPR34759.1 UPF0082 protein yeeN [Alkalidesulfovibrio alkalitolerans DSM 16529]
MAGHSKWANIRIRKGAQDAKRGKLFTKAAKELMLAARLGGGDPAANNRLRQAISYAKSINLPKDKIETAIKKGTGELQAEQLDEILYEGYAPGGVAVIVETATDNKNRTVAEIRHIFGKRGGNLGESGSVAWMFERKGMFLFPAENFTEEQLMEAALEAGAEDVKDEGEVFEMHCAFEDFGAVQQALDAASLAYSEAKVTMLPKNTVPVDAETGRKVLALLDMLEDNDDVQNVYANFDLPDEVLAEMEG